MALAGCSAEPEQQASTELPAATSTSAEPTPELPPLGPADFPVPDEARVQTEAGAEAFLRYYIDLMNHQLSIPAGAPLRELGPECNECLRIASEFDEAAASGFSYEGSEVRIDSEFGTATIADGVNLSFFAWIEGGRRVDASGRTVPDSNFDGERLPSAALLAWSPESQGWLVRAMNFG